MEGGDPAGGSGALADLLDRYCEEIQFDLLHYVGIDIVDVLRPGSGLTPGRALALIRQLPLGSATVAAIRGGIEFRGWDVERYHTAAIIDAVIENTYVLIAANSERTPKSPKPTPRPDDKAKKQDNNPFADRLKAAKQAKEAYNGGTGRD